MTIGAPEGVASPAACAVMTRPWPVGRRAPRRAGRPRRRAGRAGVWAAAQPPNQAGDEFVEFDDMAADRVERFARDPAGGAGDDGAEVGLLDQRVDVDAPDDGIQVHSFEQAIQVDPVQHGIQIDLVQQRIHIHRGKHKLDRTLRDGLGQRLAARDQPALARAPSSKLIHKLSIAGPCEPGSPLKGEPPRPCSGSAPGIGRHARAGPSAGKGCSLTWSSWRPVRRRAPPARAAAAPRMSARSRIGLPGAKPAPRDVPGSPVRDPDRPRRAAAARPPTATRAKATGAAPARGGGRRRGPSPVTPS